MWLCLGVLKFAPWEHHRSLFASWYALCFYHYLSATRALPNVPAWGLVSIYTIAMTIRQWRMELCASLVLERKPTVNPSIMMPSRRLTHWCKKRMIDDFPFWTRSFTLLINKEATPTLLTFGILYIQSFVHEAKHHTVLKTHGSATSSGITSCMVL